MIGFLVAGLIIGALARLIKPGKQNLGVLATLGLGLVGSLIGGLIAQLFGTGSIWELNVIGFILAVIAAVLLIGVARGLGGQEQGSLLANGPHVPGMSTAWEATTPRTIIDRPTERNAAVPDGPALANSGTGPT